jgi:hypothetical protein
LCLICLPPLFSFLFSNIGESSKPRGASGVRAGDRSAGAITRRFGGNEGGIETGKACGIFLHSRFFVDRMAGKRSRMTFPREYMMRRRRFSPNRPRDIDSGNARENPPPRRAVFRLGEIDVT